MPKRMAFDIIFARQVFEHLDAIDSKFDSVIEDAIAQQLEHEPITETRNRKPLREIGPFGASWELRCGPNNRFRVFYLVEPDANQVVIVAIGIKVGNRLVIGKEEVGYEDRPAR